MNITRQPSPWEDLLRQAIKVGKWLICAVVVIIVMYGLYLH